jgi:hypothetical protein
MSIAAAIIALTLAPSAASGDILCSALRRLPDDKFTYTLERGYSIIDQTAKPGPFVNTLGDDVSGFVCVREDPIPVVDDVEVLQAGFSLYLGGRKTGNRMLAIRIEDGRVTTEVSNGELDAGEQKRLAKVVAAMQARLDAGS